MTAMSELHMTRRMIRLVRAVVKAIIVRRIRQEVKKRQDVRELCFSLSTGSRQGASASSIAIIPPSFPTDRFKESRLKTMDPKPPFHKRLQSLMSQMTIQEKVAQLSCIMPSLLMGRSMPDPDLMKKFLPLDSVG